MGQSPATSKHETPFDNAEAERIDQKAPISPPAVFEVIRRAGESELSRPAAALVASGFVAGIALGFSVLTEALLRAHLPDADWRPLVENLGYTVGFLLVILGQMQLFTENTITAVCPALAEPNLPVVRCLVRLWVIVLASNLVGATIFAFILWLTRDYQPDVFRAIVSLSSHATGYPWWETLWRGVGAGWLIAALVWIMAMNERSSFVMIVLVTYVIALADFTHVIAGTSEAAVLVFTGDFTAQDAAVDYVLPALMGNILGGTGLFTLLTWAQIRADLKRHERIDW